MEFAPLSTEEQVARLTRLAARALAAWDLEGAPLDLIKYRENAVFCVGERAGSDPPHVLRVHRPRYRTDAHIRSEAAWMRALARDDAVPTPELLPTREGDVLTRVAVEGVPEPRQCDLQAWVEGEPLGTLEGGVALDEKTLRRTYRTVGEMAARIHAHGARWKRPPGFARPAWDVETLLGDAPAFGPFWELPVLTEAQRSLLFRARDRARAELEAHGRPVALVHGDLIPDNLLAGRDGVRVIDFDDCGSSWVGFELVTSLFPLRMTGGFEPGLRAWLEGYRAVCEFPTAELERLPAFLVARGLSYLGWPVGRPEIHLPEAVPGFLASRVTELAERYLSGELAAELG